MINLETVDTPHDDAFILRANEPMRIVVTRDEGLMMAHVYPGTEDEQQQDPVGGYDSSVYNSSWAHTEDTYIGELVTGFLECENRFEQAAYMVMQAHDLIVGRGVTTSFEETVCEVLGSIYNMLSGKSDDVSSSHQRTYHVTLGGQAFASTVVEVKAKSREEAESKALLECDSADWSLDEIVDTPGGIGVDYVEEVDR